jgi:hypothetical protein
MDDIEKLRAWLVENRKRFPALSRQTGIKYNWFHEFTRERIRSPGTDKYLKIKEIMDNEKV